MFNGGIESPAGASLSDTVSNPRIHSNKFNWGGRESMMIDLYYADMVNYGSSA